MKKITFLSLFLLLAILIFWMGKRFGSNAINQQIISNSTFVKQIAELASLNVQGSASIKSSNIDNNGDWTDNLKKAFLENTIWITIPYEAKYGVNIDEKLFKVTITSKKIIVQMQAPKLLSYELKIDRMETSNRKGWLLFQDDETYIALQKKLYQTSRSQLENNTIYITQSKEKIKKIIAQYYAPFLKDRTLEIQYGEETNTIKLD